MRLLKIKILSLCRSRIIQMRVARGSTSSAATHLNLSVTPITCQHNAPPSPVFPAAPFMSAPSQPPLFRLQSCAVLLRKAAKLSLANPALSRALQRSWAFSSMLALTYFLMQSTQKAASQAAQLKSPCWMMAMSQRVALRTRPSSSTKMCSLSSATSARPPA